MPALFLSEASAVRAALAALSAGRAVAYRVAFRSRIAADRSRESGYAVTLFTRSGHAIFVS